MLNSGRYRSVGAFVSDVRAYISSFKVKREKDKGLDDKSSSSSSSSASGNGESASLSAIGNGIASVDDLPAKRRRIPVLPPSPPPSSSKATAGSGGRSKHNDKSSSSSSSSKGKNQTVEPVVVDVNEDVEMLLEYFNDRLTPRLSIL